ncbi:hypothetical protein DFJ74DRAFT_505147 [Hyaloraphidium curvatum]|nr:hypothetical protein DFJ74DRAFT_505147 [Hyaloraphidium curvatum]
MPTIYDKTRRARSALRAHALLAPLNPDGSLPGPKPAPASTRPPPADPITFESRSDADWERDELVSTLERVMLATAEKRKALFKSKVGPSGPRRSDLEVEDRRMWLVVQCHEIVKKERDKVVSSRRGLSKPGSDGLSTLKILIRAVFDSLEKELLDLSPDGVNSPQDPERSRRSGRSPTRSPTRAMDIASDRRRNELRNELGISPPSGVSIKIERLKRFDDEVKNDRFRRSLDHRGLEIRGFGNKRRNLGNTLYLTDAFFPELDQDEDQSTPLLPPHVNGPITLPTTDKSLRASLRRLYFPTVSSAPQKKSNITVNNRRPYPKVKFRGRNHRNGASRASSVPPVSVPHPAHAAPELVVDPPEGASPPERSAHERMAHEHFHSDLPWLRIQTIASASDLEDKPELVAQASALVRREFGKMGCDISGSRVAEGVEEGFGWDLVVLCTPSRTARGAVREEVVAALERTFMRSYVWVHHLCVHSRYQSSGLGTWLMERCKEMARARGKDGVLLFALGEVAAWYGRQAFTDYATIPPQEEWGEDRVMVWKAELSP